MRGIIHKGWFPVNTFAWVAYTANEPKTTPCSTLLVRPQFLEYFLQFFIYLNQTWHRFSLFDDTSPGINNFVVVSHAYQ